jgi:hypothetical protein
MRCGRAWWAWAGVVALGCGGRDRPRLYSVVSLPGEAPDACRPLREPSLSSLPPGVAATLRPASDEYVWLVGETMEGPSGLQGFVGALTGRPSLVSLTSGRGGVTTTRAIAAVEGGRVMQTYFGTPLTPPFANEDGAQLALTFEARALEGRALETATAVIEAIPSGPQYVQLMGALTGGRDGKQAPGAKKPEVFLQTYVLADPRTCGSGACQAVIADQRLVVVADDPGRDPSELGNALCLSGARLHEREGGREYGGAYAVLRVAHARLPEEALGETLALRLATLSRCDKEFTPAVAGQALDALEAAPLRASDREPVRRLLEDAVFATKAATAEDRLEAASRLAGSTARVCEATPKEAIACGLAKGVLTCASSRLGTAAALREPYRRMRAALAELEAAGTCDDRAKAIVKVDVEGGLLAAAVKEARLDGRCARAPAGLACEPFAETSRRSRLAVGEAQEVLFRECYCPAVLTALGQEDAALKRVAAALRCEALPEEFALRHDPGEPWREADATRWQERRAQGVPAWTAQQCPACTRLSRRIDDEFSRAVMVSQAEAQMAVLLREALGPVSELHDVAFALMSGEEAVRCSARPAEWAAVVQAMEFSVEPRDLFGPGGRVDAARLGAKLAQAKLLKTTLDGLSCARPPPPPDPFALPPM